jgi:glutamyl-tRNA reductase
MSTPSVPLAVVGCDFRVASSAWRSRLVLTRDEAVEMARGLARNNAADGLLDLNTCNRNEWIVSTSDPRWAVALLKSHMVQKAGPDAATWFNPYAFSGDEAARHVLRVAMGQESLVVGERQIAGQLHDALEAARARDTSSRVLNGLGSVAGRLVRQAVKKGCVAGSSVGVHSLSVRYLLSRLPAGADLRIAVVGMGHIGRRVVAVAEQQPRVTVTSLNRTVDPAALGRVLPLAQLPRVLEEVDAVVVCTGAAAPILRAHHLPGRPASRPLLLLDIGIPEQVEREPLPDGVQVAGLDQLVEFHQRTSGRDDLATRDEAEELVQKALVEYRVYCRQPAFSEILDAVQRQHSQAVRDGIPRVLEKSLADLPEDLRSRLGTELHAVVVGYTNEVFKTIRDVAERLGEESCQDEL